MFSTPPLSSRATVAVACLLLLGTACTGGGGDDTPPDTGPVDAGTMDTGAVDTGGPLVPSDWFGPCVADSQCPGGVCLTEDDGYPTGYCTGECATREDCDIAGAYQHCVPGRDGKSYCNYRCLNGVDCGRPGYTCDVEAPSYLEGDFVEGNGLCIGFCAQDSDCGEGRVCDAYTGRCELPENVRTTGAINGEACANNGECRGTCIEDNANGWIDGSCVSFCILPLGYNTNTLFAEDTLPQGSCPDGNICFVNGSYTRGDLGICFDACTTNDDCRTGYECKYAFALADGSTRSFTNGYCGPIACRTRPCPDGYVCKTQNTTAGRRYWCDTP